MSRNLKNCKVKIMLFTSATVKCMANYKILTKSLSFYTSYEGTNKLNSNDSAEFIAESIVEKTMMSKSEKHDLSLPSIALRKDSLKNKANKVNDHLKELCQEKSILLIDHLNSIKQRYINRSQINLNVKGSTILDKTFVNYLSNISN